MSAAVALPDVAVRHEVLAAVRKPRAEPKRIPSLDGLRAISILLVIAGHAYRSQAHTGPHSAFWLIAGNASLGVEIFFVISGYLITGLLLREHERHGAISLRNFYVRRVFRIFPACYFYVAFIAALGAVGWLRVSWGDALSSVTFTWNYSRVAHLWAFEHLWSLSVEEQFYLLWPITLALLLRNSGRPAAVRVAGALILAAPVSRLLTHFFGGNFYSGQVPYLLHTRVDSLMFGCVCALLQGSDSFERAYDWLARFIWVFPIYVLVVSPLVRARYEARYLFTMGYTLEGFGIAVTMLWLVRNQGSVFGRILNTRGFAFLGVLSYSLYVWQQFFLNANNHWIIGGLPLNLIGAGVCALLSYKLVEQPFLTWRKRFERPRA